MEHEYYRLEIIEQKETQNRRQQQMYSLDVCEKRDLQMGITLQEFEVLCVIYAAVISSEIGETVKRVIVQYQNKKTTTRDTYR